MKYKLAGCKFTDTVTQTNTYIHKSHKISLVNGSTEGMYVVPIAAPTISLNLGGGNGSQKISCLDCSSIVLAQLSKLML